MATTLGKVGIRNLGRFDASATYAAGEFVYYMGSTFIALQNLPAGMVPQHDGINWNFLAEGASVEQVLQNFAPIEDGATVSQAYSAGSYLLHEDILYKTITDIASGGAIIIGTNITPVTIGEEMHSLAKNFANEEDSAVATMNYSVGQYLVYNEHFYKVTAAISAGQALVPGTNIEATTVGTQLSALSDSIINSSRSLTFQALSGLTYSNADSNITFISNSAGTLGFVNGYINLTGATVTASFQFKLVGSGMTSPVQRPMGFCFRCMVGDDALTPIKENNGRLTLETDGSITGSVYVGGVTNKAISIGFYSCVIFNS